MVARKLRRARVLFNVQDIHPDLAIESGILQKPRAIRLAQRFEKWVYDRSDNIPVISDGFKQNLVDKGVDPSKISIIPNWVDTNLLHPLPKDNHVARKLSLNDAFVILYSGTITLSSFLSLGRVMEALRDLRGDQDIIFAIVGEGLKKETLQEKADDLGLGNVAFIPFQPYEDLPYLLAASDVLLVPLDKEKSQLSVPSKLYNYMAAGRAILGLTESSSEVAKILTDTNCGIYAASDNVDKIAEAIRTLKNSKDYRDSLAANARKYAVEHYAKDKILKMFEDLMESL